MQIRAFAVGLALAWATIGGARAADVLFTIIGGGTTTTFELPLNPAPLLNNKTGFVIPGFSFEIFSVPTTVNGVAKSPTELSFYSTGLGTGGFLATGLFRFSGPQFYEGPESNPTFVSDINSLQLRNVFGGVTDLVTVVDPPDPSSPPGVLAVPELSTWAMLLLGFLGLGYTGYRNARRRAHETSP
jgi:hypothetical protein